MSARLALLAGLAAFAAALAWLLPQLSRPPAPFDVAMALMDDGRAKDAVYLFEDPHWRGIAEYRAGRYRRALGEFYQNESVLTLYNTGNSYAQLHDWAGAKSAYEKALRLDPAHADARFNLDLVRRAEALEKQLLEESRAQTNLGRWEDGNRDEPEQGTGESNQIEEGGAREGATRAASTQVDQGGRSDLPGLAGEQALSEDAEGGPGDTSSTDQRQAEGRTGTATMVLRQESSQAAEILLRGIADDPSKVLAARLYMAHKRRLEREAR